MSLDAVKNFGKVTVSGTYDANAFVIEVSDGTRFPNPAVSGQCNVVWYNDTDYPDPADDSNVEIVRVTAVSGNVVTLANNGTSRIAQEGTTTSTKNTASKTYKMFLGITAKMITDIQSQIITSISQLVLSAVGNVDNLNTNFTFSNLPTYIVINGTLYPQNNGWTWNAGTLTATLSGPVGTGGFIIGIL